MSKLPDRSPGHVQALRKRVANLVPGQTEQQAQFLLRTITMVAVGQMLPASAVKGGTAMKLRLGVDGSRFSKDLDVARREGLDKFLTDFDTALRDGWGGFTGEIRASTNVSRPLNIPADYIMVARRIKVNYMGLDLLSMDLEIGHDELDDTLDPPTVLARDIPELFAALGLPAPDPIPVVADDHQIAQKLHAVSSPGSLRAHDLVDLQLLERISPFDDAQVGALCVRLFRFRKAHEWPPTIVAGDGWDDLYQASIGDLPVVPRVDEAVTWVNEYIARLDVARPN